MLRTTLASVWRALSFFVSRVALVGASYALFGALLGGPAPAADELSGPRCVLPVARDASLHSLKVSIDIAADGSVSKVRTLRPSGNDNIDAVARACISGWHYPTPTPQSHRELTLDLSFLFKQRERALHARQLTPSRSTTPISPPQRDNPNDGRSVPSQKDSPPDSGPKKIPTAPTQGPPHRAGPATKPSPDPTTPPSRIRGDNEGRWFERVVSSVTSTIRSGWDSLSDGATYILEGGPRAWVAFLFGALLLWLASTLLLWTVRFIRLRRRRLQEFIIEVFPVPDNEIHFNATLATEWRLGRTNDQVVVVARGLPFVRRLIRGKLQRKYNWGDDPKVGVSALQFETLTGRPAAESPLTMWDVTIKSGRTIWYHPDPAIRIPTRVAAFLAAIGTLVSILASAFFWWIPPHVRIAENTQDLEIHLSAPAPVRQSMMAITHADHRLLF